MLFNSKKANLWFSCLIPCTCMAVNGYDSSTFNAVQGSVHFMNYFNNPSPSTIGSVNTAMAVSSIITGVFLSALVSDRFGRKWSMWAGTVLVIISTFISTFTPPVIGGYIAGRAITGFGQGLMLPAGPVFINEIAPAKLRGTIMSFWQLNFAIGSFVAYWINYACSKHAERLGDWDWKIVMFLQIFFPVIIISGLFFCPETPRWYVQNDRFEEAYNTLLQIRDDPDLIAQEMKEIRQAIAFEKKETNSTWTRYKLLWTDKSVRRRILLAATMNIGQQLTGNNSLATYSTIIYKKVFTSNSQIQLINALAGTFNILFTLNATWMTDLVGRRPLLLVGVAGLAVCMFAAAAVVTETPTLEDGSKSSSVGIATVFLMFLFAFFFKPSWGATVWIWTSEIFSMNIQQIFPIFLSAKGFYAMYMFGAINILLFAFVWFCIPETKGVPLEHMDALFGGVDHTEVGAAIVSEKTVHDEMVSVYAAKTPTVRQDKYDSAV
ncbi:HXT3-low-affinity hexose facilitator [Fusarium subglutinans]|uniref:HXT3-low-affinity hexose facilitator n=1 Tax=Gibberella subglutinans TaxID=42677 RepID=A0A8H5L442_GIBSU|nr:HXT3-low-affinity hexose facilitator [Fusarium subglutinans]KAF5586004.1 HXT3-low-affinity hexose facilitator [Fusarium subglutinans]